MWQMLIEHLDFNKVKYALRAWKLDILIWYGNFLNSLHFLIWMSNEWTEC